MAVFTDRMVPERVQPFWAALQRGELIIDAAAEAGTYRKKGTRWVAAARRGATDLVDGPGELGLDVVAVEGDLGGGEVLQGAGQVALGHVLADL